MPVTILNVSEFTSWADRMVKVLLGIWLLVSSISVQAQASLEFAGAFGYGNSVHRDGRSGGNMVSSSGSSCHTSFQSSLSGQIKLQFGAGKFVVPYTRLTFGLRRDSIAYTSHVGEHSDPRTTPAQYHWSRYTYFNGSGVERTNLLAWELGLTLTPLKGWQLFSFDFGLRARYSINENSQGTAIETYEEFSAQSGAQSTQMPSSFVPPESVWSSRNLGGFRGLSLLFGANMYVPVHKQHQLLLAMRFEYRRTRKDKDSLTERDHPNIPFLAVIGYRLTLRTKS